MTIEGQPSDSLLLDTNLALQRENVLAVNFTHLRARGLMPVRNR